jgi:SOS-response transcriptional repressor LexA
VSLTRRQQQCYVLVRDFIQAKGYSPTYADLAKMIGVSSLATVHAFIHSLIRKGYLTKNQGKIELVPTKMQGLNSCFNGHETVWFFGDNGQGCPLCEVLKRGRGI